MYYDLLRFILRCSDLLGGPLPRVRVAGAGVSTLCIAIYCGFILRSSDSLGGLRILRRCDLLGGPLPRKGEQSLPCDQLRLILLPRVNACGAKAISNYGLSILHCPTPFSRSDLLEGPLSRVDVACAKTLFYLSCSALLLRRAWTTVNAEGSLCITTY